VLHQQLTTAGIKTKVTILERGARVTRESSGDFMLVLSGSDIPGDPAQEFRSEFGCREEETKAKRRTENSSGYCNKEVDRLLAEADQNQSEETSEIYSRVVKIFHGDPRYLQPVCATSRVSAKLRGFKTDNVVALTFQQ
jgi:ABC-type transport system substrate-binding protein